MSIDPAAQLEAVRLLIKQNKFDRARTILEGMEGKKAQRWLAELNERHPPLLAAVSPVKPSPVEIPPELRLDEMDEVKQAIREKRYDDAEALLIISDHPDAEKLRDRLAQIRGGKGPSLVMPVKQKSMSTGSTVRRAIIAFLVLAVVGVGGTLFVIRQSEIANRPEKIYDQLLGVCFHIALQNEESKNLPGDALGWACDSIVVEYMSTYPAIAEQCYLETGGGTLEWFGCDANDYAEFNYDYLVDAVNVYR